MNNKEHKYENKEICKKCGGFCCKKSGCDYFVSDFENMSLKYLDEILKTGRVSIIASFDFKRLKSNKLVCTPVLSLRARNINREIVDLLSFKTTCASLEENGCYYELDKRPSGGAVLIPCEDEPCHSKVDRIEEIKKWLPYQKVLERLVKRYTTKSVTEKLKEDVETLVYNCLTGNYKDSSEIEIEEVFSMLPLLKEYYKEEYNKAEEKLIKKNKLVLTKNKTPKH